MDRQQLHSVLRHEGVSAQAYTLDLKAADTPEGTYVIDPYAFGWHVFYKGDATTVRDRTFGSEDEACEHLLNLILRDPRTRVTHYRRVS